MRKILSCAALVVVSAAASQSWAAFEGPSSPINLGDPADPFDSFDVVIRVGFGHDDNVQLAQDVTFFGAETESTFADAALNAVFRERVSPSFVWGLGLRAEAVGFLDEIDPALQPAFGNYSDYDRLAINPSVFADLVLGGVDVRASYDFRYEEAENIDVGVNAHRIALAVLHDCDAQWRIRGGVAHVWNDYDVFFDDPEDRRDGTHTSINVGADYFIDGGYTVLSATLGASVNDADGSNWDYTGYSASVGARTVIVPHLFGSAEVGYEWRDYDGFISGFIPPPGRTEQGVFSAKAKLVYAINNVVSADVFVSYSDYDSNLPQFEGDQTVIGGGLTTKLY